MKRLIFTVTTGRSGTDYLAHLFETVPGVTSLHEPKPHFVWAMREAQSDPLVARNFWVDQKLPAIEALPGRTYVETSHLVCKGFLEPLLELGHTADLILLRRSHRDVAASMFRLNTIPGRTPKGWKWYLMPEDPGVLPLPGWEGLHDYQLCYWYCLEIERRRQHYARLFRDAGARVVAADLTELSTIRGFRDLRAALGLPTRSLDPRSWVRLRRRIGTRSNKQRLNKKPVALPAGLEELEAEVVDRARASEFADLRKVGVQ